MPISIVFEVIFSKVKVTWFIIPDNISNFKGSKLTSVTVIKKYLPHANIYIIVLQFECAMPK